MPLDALHVKRPRPDRFAPPAEPHQLAAAMAQSVAWHQELEPPQHRQPPAVMADSQVDRPLGPLTPSKFASTNPNSDCSPRPTNPCAIAISPAVVRRPRAASPPEIPCLRSIRSLNSRLRPTTSDEAPFRWTFTKNRIPLSPQLAMIAIFAKNRFAGSDQAIAVAWWRRGTDGQARAAQHGQTASVTAADWDRTPGSCSTRRRLSKPVLPGARNRRDWADSGHGPPSKRLRCIPRSCGGVAAQPDAVQI
jgi:hypothetical protein